MAPALNPSTHRAASQFLCVPGQHVQHSELQDKQKNIMKHNLEKNDQNPPQKPNIYDKKGQLNDTVNKEVGHEDISI